MPTVAACLLNVRLVLHPENVSTVHGMNVVATGSVRHLPKMSSIQCRSSLVVRNGPGGI